MDVHCSTCQEPWDTYHLWQDAIYETDLEDPEIKRWFRLSRTEQLSEYFREVFRRV